MPRKRSKVWSKSQFFSVFGCIWTFLCAQNKLQSADVLRIKLENNKYHSILCILYLKWSILTHFYPTTFFLIFNKAEAKGKFRLFLNWQLLFNFARPLAILLTESANILICFCCTSTKRAVWDQNEVLGWDLRSRTRGWCRTQNTCKFVKKRCRGWQRPT